MHQTHLLWGRRAFNIKGVVCLFLFPGFSTLEGKRNLVRMFAHKQRGIKGSRLQNVGSHHIWNIAYYSTATGLQQNCSESRDIPGCNFSTITAVRLYYSDITTELPHTKQQLNNSLTLASSSSSISGCLGLECLCSSSWKIVLGFSSSDSLSDGGSLIHASRSRLVRVAHKQLGSIPSSTSGFIIISQLYFKA